VGTTRSRPPTRVGDRPGGRAREDHGHRPAPRL